MSEQQTVTIVGLGALGSHLVLLARNWPVELRLIDFDRVEAKNIESQWHSRLGLSNNKAVAIQRLMQGLFKQKVEARPVKLVADNARELLGHSKLVIDCTDNAAARTLIKETCQQLDIHCLHGCLSAAGDFARVVWAENFVVDQEGEAGQATCEDGRNLAFHVQAAAMIVQVARLFLESGKKQSWQLTPFSVVRLG